MILLVWQFKMGPEKSINIKNVFNNKNHYQEQKNV